MEVLHKAITVARENGWSVFGATNVMNGVWRIEDGILDVGFDDVESGGGTIWRRHYSLEQIIFNLDFALALCGDSRTLETHMQPANEHFLTRIALSPNRLEYLETFMEEK